MDAAPQIPADSQSESAQPKREPQGRVLKIPLSKLMPNEDQPRHRFNRESVQALSESLKALGQQTYLKVRPLTAQEKAGYTKDEIQWHGEGFELPEKPVGERGFEYMVIGGHRRLEAAQLAGFESLECVVLEITPEETHLAALMDNNLEAMDWWDWDLAIEAEHKAFPDLTQRQLAQRLGISKGKVGNALVLAKAMDETARMVIELNLSRDPQDSGEKHPEDGPNPDSGNHPAQPLGKPKARYRITESILLILARLEDPEMMADTVEFTIYKQLSEALAPKMVEWVDQGGDPQDFDPQAASKAKEEDPLAEVWKGLGPGIKVKHKGGEDYEIHLSVTGGQKAVETALAAQAALRGGAGAKLAAFLNGFS